MQYSGAGGNLFREKNQKQNSRDRHCSFKGSSSKHRASILKIVRIMLNIVGEVTEKYLIKDKYAPFAPISDFSVKELTIALITDIELYTRCCFL
jgi:uncharacterized protein YfbU (UPF0304 family)